VVWLGLGIAYFSVYPPGFWIAVVAFAVYLISRLAAGSPAGRRGRPSVKRASRGAVPASSRAA
jgi:zinc/manganese transport system permease protein